MWVLLVSVLFWIHLWIILLLVIREIQENVENDLNFENQHLLIRKSDENTLYMKVSQKNITNTDTLPI